MKFKSLSQDTRRSRSCQLCGWPFVSIFSRHRVCSPCMEKAASQAPICADGRVFLPPSFGVKALSHVELTAAGLSAPTPGGFRQVVDAGRCCDTFGLTLDELARATNSERADLTPPPPPTPKGAYGAIRTRNGFIRAMKCAGGWRAQIGRLDGAGVVRWRAVGTLQKTKVEALQLAREMGG